MSVVGALLRLITVVTVAAAFPCRGEDASSGRWEGSAQVPNDQLDVIVDLAQQNGAWTGSIIIPGFFANDRRIRVGGIYSSPLVVNGVVYFGSADGFLYVLD